MLPRLCAAIESIRSFIHSFATLASVPVLGWEWGTSLVCPEQGHLSGVAEGPGRPEGASELGVVTVLYSSWRFCTGVTSRIWGGVFFGREGTCRGRETGRLGALVVRGMGATRGGRQIHLQCRGRGLVCVLAGLGVGSGCL